MRPAWSSPRFLVASIVLLSALLRIGLAYQGGQYCFGDEQRYDRAIGLYLAFADGDFATVRALAGLPDHPAFQWLGAGVAAIQHLCAQLTPYGDWRVHPAHIETTVWIGAALLSLFSAANIYLVYRLARIAGASTEEGAWAALLMATANTAFYHARHLLPYDCALTAALLALIVGLAAPTSVRAASAGALAGLCYGFYNGYWFLVPIVGVVYAIAVHARLQPRRLLGWFAAGAFIALALPVAFGAWAGGDYYWSALHAFSTSVTQGLFAEGWLLPWKYLWHSEGALGLALIALIAAALWSARARGRPPARLLWWTLALATSYALLVLGSTILQRFVVYGRSVKPFVPFFCLLGGWALSHLLMRRPRLKPLAAISLALAGVSHFYPHFLLIFPREFELTVLREIGHPKRTLSVSGSLYTPRVLPITRPDLALVNAQMLFPIVASLGYPAGETILEARHPLTYLPYQYEGYTPRERAFLRENDVSMRLIRLARPAALPDDLPPPHRARREDRHRGR